MVDDKLETIIISDTEKPTQCIIWMHGLGADATDFVDIADILQLDRSKVEYVFPYAPVRPITVNDGMMMRGWYDLESLGLRQNEDAEGIYQSQQLINQLIDEQVAKGVPAENIVLAGFSQGGAMAVFTALRYPKPLAGAIGLSCYNLLAATLAEGRHAANDQLPIFLGHGMFDPMVTYQLGEKMHQELQSHGYTVELKSYPIQHTVSEDEIHDIGQFLQQVL